MRMFIFIVALSILTFSLNVTTLWSVPSGFKPKALGVTLHRVVILKPPCFFILDLKNGNNINTVCVASQNADSRSYTITVIDRGIIAAKLYSPRCCVTNTKVIYYNENGTVVNEIKGINYGEYFKYYIGSVALVGNYTLVSLESGTYVIKGEELSLIHDSPLLFYNDMISYAIAFDPKNIKSVIIDASLRVTNSFSCIGIVPMVLKLSSHEFLYECILPDLKSTAFYSSNITHQKLINICSGTCSLVGYHNGLLFVVRDNTLYVLNTTSNTWSKLIPAELAIQSIVSKNVIVIYSNGYIRAVKIIG